MSILQHILDLINAASLEKLIGLFYMTGIISYMMFIAVNHKKEFWEAIRGKDKVLEVPEMIIMLVIIVYINIVLADTFLGLKPSDGVFWSLDAIILFALTGRIAMNRFGGGNSNGSGTADGELKGIGLSKEDAVALAENIKANSDDSKKKEPSKKPKKEKPADTEETEEELS